jgi:lysine-specific demethylase 8
MKFFGLDENLINYENDINQTQNYPDFVLNYLKSIKSNILRSLFNENEVEILIDYSWEKLNTNLWVFVDKKWRYLYGYSILYKILGFSLLKEVINVNEIIKLCDMGLLMSGPLLEKQFNQIINFLIKSNQTNNIESFDINIKKRKLSDVELTIHDEHALKIEISPSIETFREEFFLKNTPVIIDKQMEHWPAMSKWSIEYLKMISGQRTVPIEIGSKYTEEDWSQKLMTINEFIDRFIVNEQNTGYLAQHPLFDQV